MTTGIYRAIHSGHRMSHEVTVLENTIFPKCRRCGFEVRFSLIKLMEARSVVARPLTGILVPFDHEEDQSSAAKAG
jgi:hypothetical protein